MAKMPPAAAPKPVTSPLAPVVKPKKVAAAEKKPRKRPAPKPAVTTPEPTRESKRARVQATLYQSPDPELLQIIKQTKAGGEVKIEAPKVKSKPEEPASPASTAVFFRGEHLAVRNAEGSFYLCQASQNIYRHSKKIKIQWLGLAPENNAAKDLYLPEYYDTTG